MEERGRAHHGKVVGEGRWHWSSTAGQFRQSLMMMKYTTVSTEENGVHEET
jgi:hypothetical protein